MASSSLRNRIGLLAVSGLLVIGCSSGSVQTLGFGSGGTACEVSGAATTFTLGQVVHMAATFSVPPKHVDIAVTRDGAPDKHSGAIDMGETEDCVAARFPDLVAGHYVVTLTPVPSLGTPSLSGAFDVTR